MCSGIVGLTFSGARVRADSIVIPQNITAPPEVEKLIVQVLFELFQSVFCLVFINTNRYITHVSWNKVTSLASGALDSCLPASHVELTYTDKRESSHRCFGNTSPLLLCWASSGMEKSAQTVWANNPGKWSPVPPRSRVRPIYILTRQHLFCYHSWINLCYLIDLWLYCIHQKIEHIM